MTWIVILHLVNPFTQQYTLDTIPVQNQLAAIYIKDKIESSPIYINADPRLKGFVEIKERVQ